MTHRTIMKISKLLIEKAAQHACRTVMVLNREFDLEVNDQIAEKCLAESIAMEWLIIDILIPDQYEDEKTAIVNSILETTEECLLRGWKTRYIGEWFDEYFHGAVRTYPIPESVFSPDYSVQNYVSNDHPPHQSIINHFMERIADLVDIPDPMSQNVCNAMNTENPGIAPPQSTIAIMKAVISLLADNHVKHLLITQPLKKLLSVC